MSQPLDQPFPNQEQKQILDSSSRISVVKASPGSGKTRVFTEFIKLKVPSLPRGKGLAALSFTNAASEEISMRVGISLSAPHFVGTIDSFMFRFILKPFGRLLDLPVSGITIVPGFADNHFGKDSIQVGQANSQRANVFSIKFSGGSLSRPELRYPTDRGYEQVDPSYLQRVIKAKWDVWKRSGILNHSDCQYLSALLLNHSVYGPQISNLICTKFPWILVDEFQDTGLFLTTALSKILENPNVQCLVVGDPDQSIFEFSGASPSNFGMIEQISGAQIFTLTKTQRFGVNLAKVVSMLSASQTTVQANQELENGRLIIVPHTHTQPVIDSKVIEIAKGIGQDIGQILFLARKNKELKYLTGNFSETYFKGKSRAARVISEAVEKLREGRVTEAFTLASGRIGELIFESAVLKKADLSGKEIDWADWRKEILNILTRLDSEVQGESWNNWVARVKSEVTSLASKCNITIARLGDNFKSDKNDGGELRTISRSGTSIDPFFGKSFFKNIHEAKGSEADTVIWYIPKLSESKCISKLWFGSTGEELEERRVGFVGLSRAKKNLILNIHKDSLARLQKSNPNFIAIFEQIRI